MNAREIEAADHTVLRCIDTKPTPDGTLYLIETTFRTFPRFVIGRVNGEAVAHLLKCGREDTAREEWAKMTQAEMGGAR